MWVFANYPLKKGNGLVPAALSVCCVTSSFDSQLDIEPSSPPSSLIGRRLLNLSQDDPAGEKNKRTTQRLKLQKGDRLIYLVTFYRFIRKRFAVAWSMWTPRVKSFDSGRGDLILGLQPFAHWLFCSGSRERTDAVLKRISVFLPNGSVHFFSFSKF